MNDAIEETAIPQAPPNPQLLVTYEAEKKNFNFKSDNIGSWEEITAFLINALQAANKERHKQSQGKTSGVILAPTGFQVPR